MGFGNKDTYSIAPFHHDVYGPLFHVDCIDRCRQPFAWSGIIGGEGGWCRRRCSRRGAGRYRAGAVARLISMSAKPRAMISTPRPSSSE